MNALRNVTSSHILTTMSHKDGALGYRGYDDESTVDLYLEHLRVGLTVTDGEVARLRAEVERLHRYIRRQWAVVAVAATEAGRPPVSPADQAWAVLARAQKIADRLLTGARPENLPGPAVDRWGWSCGPAQTLYEQIVVRAHRQADRATAVARDELDSGLALDRSGRVRAELELKATYLRTFAKTSRSALPAAVELTAGEFGRLMGVSGSSEMREIARVPGPVEVTFAWQYPGEVNVRA